MPGITAARDAMRAIAIADTAFPFALGVRLGVWFTARTAGLLSACTTRCCVLHLTPYHRNALLCVLLRKLTLCRRRRSTACRAGNYVACCAPLRVYVYVLYVFYRFRRSRACLDQVIFIRVAASRRFTCLIVHTSHPSYRHASAAAMPMRFDPPSSICVYHWI